MNHRKKYLYVLMVMLAGAILSGCATQKHQTHAFKEPTKEDLARAIDTYVKLTYMYVEKKDFEHAMANVKHALDNDPNSPAAIDALAVVYQYQGDTDKARENFRKVIELNSKFSQGHLDYGEFLFQQKEYAEACHQFQVASEDDFFDKRALAYYNLGVCYKVAGDPVKAEAALTRCAGLDTNYAPAYLVLSLIRFDQQRYPESEENFDKYYQILHTVGQSPSAEAAWLGIRLDRIFGNPDGEASLALFLKNTYPYSKEYLEYRNSLKK
jgi:type IV pilus assembly protein PilF